MSECLIYHIMKQRPEDLEIMDDVKDIIKRIAEEIENGRKNKEGTVE